MVMAAQLVTILKKITEFFFLKNGDLDKNVAMKGMRNNQTLDVFCIES